jgi:hypothetical protein
MAYYGYRTKTYATDVDGHRVEVEFDKSLVVLNRVRLLVDGKEVDRGSIFYGSTTLGSDTPPVRVEIGSGWIGQMKYCRLRAGERQEDLAAA